MALDELRRNPVGDRIQEKSGPGFTLNRGGAVPIVLEKEVGSEGREKRRLQWRSGFMWEILVIP